MHSVANSCKLCHRIPEQLQASGTFVLRYWTLLMVLVVALTSIFYSSLKMTDASNCRSMLLELLRLNKSSTPTCPASSLLLNCSEHMLLICANLALPASAYL